MSCFPVFDNNQVAVQVAHNPVNSSKSKYIDVCHHFRRERVYQRDMTVIKFLSDFQDAGVFTKA